MANRRGGRGKRNMLKVDQFAKFREWLAARGAEVLEPTSQWEAVRFRGEGVTSIIYVRKSGNCTFTGEARRAWEAYEAGDQSFRLTKRAPRLSQEKRSPIVATLIERDGARCFYCAEPFTDALPPTREHLVPRTAGGPDHIANLFLACEPCNLEVGHASAPEKIRFRDRKRRGAGTALLIDLRPHVEALSVTDDDPEFKTLLSRLDAIIHHPQKETANGRP